MSRSVKLAMSQSKVRLSKLPINGKDSMKAADVFVYGGSGDPSEISFQGKTSGNLFRTPFVNKQLGLNILP